MSGFKRPEMDDDYDTYDPWDDEDEMEAEMNCGFIPEDGICVNAGTEYCDWSCPFNPCDPEGI